MKHVTHIKDLGPEGVEAVLAQASAWKLKAPGQPLFPGSILGMVFFNPSLRTRTSFEAVMRRGGGNAIILDVGAGVIVGVASGLAVRLLLAGLPLLSLAGYAILG